MIKIMAIIIAWCVGFFCGCGGALEAQSLPTSIGLGCKPGFLKGGQTRTLSLYHLHTGEKLDKAVYWRNGQYDKAGLNKLNYLLRDHRTGDIPCYDPKVFDILYHLSEKTGNRRNFEIICGYRCQKTNDMIRARSTGVAKNSQHIQGKAIDFRLPGTPLRTLYKAACTLKAGGVGYYEKSNFIHVDIGPVRYW